MEYVHEMELHWIEQSPNMVNKSALMEMEKNQIVFMMIRHILALANFCLFEGEKNTRRLLPLALDNSKMDHIKTY